MITKKTYTIPYMFADRYGDISIRNLAGLMFEVSYNQASIAEKEIDMNKLRWIVYSWDLDLFDTLKVADEVEVVTLSLDMKKFYAYRNFYVKRDGKLVAQAYVVFLLMDIERMRPVKTTEELLTAYGPEEAVYKPEKFSYTKEFDHSKIIATRHNDIDSNFHVNNAVYFDYVCDLCKIDSKDIRHFNIVYKNEIRNKNDFVAEFSEYDNQIDFRLKSSVDDTIYTYGKVIRNV